MSSPSWLELVDWCEAVELLLGDDRAVTTRLARHTLRVPLDPIVSLSVAIAEAPGSYAFFLGSGVSRDAGVPTGGEVFWLAVGNLYRVENTTEETPDEAALGAWLKETDREGLGYSDVLELIAPDMPTRRDYLAKHFEGVEPAAAHQRLAELASRGLVRVFVTTNFDRLLESALEARGIHPVVITSDEDLQRAPGREHAPCYVVKPHGDYLQQTIRNTPAELGELPPALTAELEEIFNRYGLVMLGYAGADEAVGRALRDRDSRYGLYWVSRGELPATAAVITEATRGRAIQRPSAAAFLADLDRRLAVFEAQPSGETPAVVNDEVLRLLQSGDRVGLAELLRRERREYEDRITGLIDEHWREQATPDAMVQTHDTLLPVFERRLASLLPLAQYDDDLLVGELAALATMRARRPRRGGSTFWLHLDDWGTWWLATTIGGFCVNQGRFETLRVLFAARVPGRPGRPSEPLVSAGIGNPGQSMAPHVLSPEEKRHPTPMWWLLLKDLPTLELLQNAYPEFVAREEEPFRSMVEFDFLLCISLGLSDDDKPAAHWTMYGDSAADDFAYRLHGDDTLRRRIAAICRVSLDEFDDSAPDALRSGHHFGSFPDLEAADILQHGSR